eukprot:g458.t1
MHAHGRSQSHSHSQAPHTPHTPHTPHAGGERSRYSHPRTHNYKFDRTTSKYPFTLRSAGAGAAASDRSRDGSCASEDRAAAGRSFTLFFGRGSWGSPGPSGGADGGASATDTGVQCSYELAASSAEERARWIRAIRNFKLGLPITYVDEDEDEDEGEGEGEDVEQDGDEEVVDAADGQVVAAGMVAKAAPATPSAAGAHDGAGAAAVAASSAGAGTGPHEPASGSTVSAVLNEVKQGHAKLKESQMQLMKRLGALEARMDAKLDGIQVQLERLERQGGESGVAGGATAAGDKGGATAGAEEAIERLEAKIDRLLAAPVPAATPPAGADRRLIDRRAGKRSNKGRR